MLYKSTPFFANFNFFWKKYGFLFVKCENGVIFCLLQGKNFFCRAVVSFQGFS